MAPVRNVTIEKPDIIWRFAVLFVTVTGFTGSILYQSLLVSKGVLA